MQDEAIVAASIAELRAALESRRITARALTAAFLDRIAAIDGGDGGLRSVIEVNPDALAIAEACDAALAAGGPRGPLHGVPLLIKDNIDTADAMHTTAGALALLGSRPTEDATVVARLRAAGAVIIGKTNLSEWANFHSDKQLSGWSGRGGQTRNPHDRARSPSGSSSGSAAAVAAALAAAALGTETNGSIVDPAGACGIVGLKPTVGLVSRAGVIPLAGSQDTVGPMTRGVADAALLLGVLAGVDGRDAATVASDGRMVADYTQFLDADGLRGARIGVAREVYCGYHRETDAVIEAAIALMRQRGAVIVDPANIPTARAIADTDTSRTVLLYEFHAQVDAYLAGRAAWGEQVELRGVRSLADVVAYNRAHAAETMPFAGQEILEAALATGPLTDTVYTEALATNRRLAREQGIDAAMDEYRLDALIAPTSHPAWLIDHVLGDLYLGGSSTPAALAGYPLISLNAGFVHGLPVGLTLMGRAWSEPTLIRLAYAFELARGVGAG